MSLVERVLKRGKQTSHNAPLIVNRDRELSSSPI
jgi:hypothetical protein